MLKKIHHYDDSYKRAIVMPKYPLFI